MAFASPESKVHASDAYIKIKRTNQIKSNLFCHKFSTQYNNEFALRLTGQTGDNFALMSAHDN